MGITSENYVIPAKSSLLSPRVTCMISFVTWSIVVSVATSGGENRLHHVTLMYTPVELAIDPSFPEVNLFLISCYVLFFLCCREAITYGSSNEAKRNK